jgi:hypothetical protein
MMNPYTLMEDLKEIGFLSPFLVKSFTIVGTPNSEDGWIANIKTNLGLIYIKSTDLGYSEFSIPVLTIPDSDTDTLIEVSQNVISAHSECVGYVSLEFNDEDPILFYHLILIDNYDKDILRAFVSTMTDDSNILVGYVSSLVNRENDKVDKSINLDRINDQLGFMDDEDSDIEDESDD